MSVLIRNMELPECCDKCPFKVYVGVDHLECKITGHRFYVWEVGWGDKPYTRHESCPFIELPPHGRLIDGDAVEKQIDYVANLEWNKQVGASFGMFAALEIVEDALTIIEADYPPATPLEQVWTEVFGEDECKVCANADNEYCFACDNGNQFKPINQAEEGET